MPPIIRHLSQMDADNVSYKVQGFSGSAPVNTATNIDWKFPEARYLTGGQLLVNGGSWGDTVKVQVVDVDNIYGFGAGAVLGEHVSNFMINPAVCLQISIECPYVALIPANIYIRIRYTNTSLSTPVSIAMNMFSHIPK